MTNETPGSTADDSSSYSRRRFLALAGSGVAVGLAGCSEGAGDPTGGTTDSRTPDGGSPGTDAGPESTPGLEDMFGGTPDPARIDPADFECSMLGGEPVAYDPGERDYAFSLSHHDSWREFDRMRTADLTNSHATFGHRATSYEQGLTLYAYSYSVEQDVEPVDDDTAYDWLATEFRDVVHRTAYGGEELEVTQWPTADEELHLRVALPSSDGWHKVYVRGGYGWRDDDGPAPEFCQEAFREVGFDVIDWFEPR